MMMAFCLIRRDCAVAVATRSTWCSKRGFRAGLKSLARADQRRSPEGELRDLKAGHDAERFQTMSLRETCAELERRVLMKAAPRVTDKLISVMSYDTCLIAVFIPIAAAVIYRRFGT